jgi:hypothetical protein
MFLRIFMFSHLIIASAYAIDYKILVLPSGGAVGVIPATFLHEIELRTKKPIHEHFSEVWCSSVGAMTAAMLTTKVAPPKKATSGFMAQPGFEPRTKRSKRQHTFSLRAMVINFLQIFWPKTYKPQPASFKQTTPDDSLARVRSAKEVQEFLTKNFSSIWHARAVLKAFKRNIPSSSKLKDTVIPLRIVSGEVKKWIICLAGIWAETELRASKPTDSGACALSALVCGSCAIPPIIFLFLWNKKMEV